MSNEAVKWAMDEAPMLRTDKGKPDTTARHVLQALAEHAHKDGSNARPSVLRIQYRTGYDRRTVQRALRRLEAAKLIAAKGVVNGCTSYALDLTLRRPVSDWKALEAEEEGFRQATAARVRRHRGKKRVTHSDDVTVTHSNDVTDGDVTHFNDVRNAFEVRDVTHSASVRNALNAARTISEPPAEPPPTEDSPEPAPSPSSPNDPGTEDGGGNAAHQEQRRSDAVEFLRALPSPWGVGRVTAQAMAPLLLQSLTDTGWNLDSALVAKLTENPGGVRSPHAVLPLRIADLPKRSQPAPRRSAIPDWCGQCAGGDPMAKTEPSMRWIDTADGATVPCPECSLQAHRTPAA